MKTYLALREKDGEGIVGFLSSLIIRLRLVTRYPHAGIVVEKDNVYTLYHSNAKHGVTKEVFEHDGWVLFEVDNTIGLNTIKLFDKHKGSGYDWISLLAFVCLPTRDSRRWYCYEWCYQCMTGKIPTDRVNPEDLLIIAIRGRNV